MRSLQRRVTHAVVASVTVCAVLVSASTTASAAPVVRNVPGDYPSIQAGIDAAVNGDTVLVAPGTYSEHRIDFHGKAIKVVGAAGAASTVIDGNGVGPIVFFHSLETRASVLKGFTIQHGFTDFGSVPGYGDAGGGVSIVHAMPTIKLNVIQDNAAVFAGGGIAEQFGAPLITHNIIQRNGRGPQYGDGGGVFLGGEGAPVVTDNVIQDNATTDGGGIGLFAAGSPIIRNNVIRRNRAVSSHGGGIYAVNQSDALFEQNLVVDNIASDEGGGAYWLVPGNTRGPYLVNNTFVGNQAASGSALTLAGFDSASRVVNNIAVSESGSSVLDCGDYPRATVPLITFNNVHSTTVPRYGRNCTDQTGVNSNISADPLFVDPTAGDYHLRGASPSVDAGDSDAPGLTPWDLDGNPRIVGSAIDQGVYEAQPGADLALGLTATPNPAMTGRLLTWTLTATNHGPRIATNVQLHDTWPNALPGGVQFRRVATSTGSCAWDGATTLTCSLGALPSGASATITLVVKPRGPGMLANTATLAAHEFDPNTADNTASVQVTVRPS